MEKSPYNFIGKPKENGLNWNHRSKRNANIKSVLREIWKEDVDWIRLALDGAQLAGGGYFGHSIERRSTFWALSEAYS